MKWNERFAIVASDGDGPGIRCEVCQRIIGPVGGLTLSDVTQAAYGHWRAHHWTPRPSAIRRAELRCIRCNAPVRRTPSGHFMDRETSYRCPSDGAMHVGAP